ncbi:MAG TPA: hypothetical protein VFW70_06280, partial [Methylomirabilota bacterium]|nr:hypothetical protein [Methylomirabilota bacterium]
MPGSRARCVLLALVLLLLPALGHAQPRRLAIFDLANDTGDPALDWVGAALSVSLRERLGALGALELLGPRPASPVSRDRAAAGALEPLLRRARAVGAEQALLGRYTRAGSRLRVEARVVDVASALTVSVATHDAPESDTAAAFTRIGDAILDAALDALAARSVPGSIEPLTVVRGARPPLAPHEARLAAQPWTLERAATETLGRAVAAFDDGRREDAISDLERVTAGGGAPATVWLLLGAARAQRGDCARAAPALERTLEWSHRQGHVRAEIMSRYRIASCLAEAADDHGAVAALEEIRRRAAAVGYVSVEIWALHAAGVAHERAGRADEALAAWRESARLAERTGDAAQQAGVLPRIATMLYRQAKFGEALVVAGRAAELAEAAEQADDRIAALALMGLAEDAQGRRAQG